MARSSQHLSSRSGEPQVILGYVTSLTPAWDRLKSPTVQQQYRFETFILVVLPSSSRLCCVQLPCREFLLNPRGLATPGGRPEGLQPVFAEGRKAKENKGTEGGGGRGGRAHCPSHTGSPLWAGHCFLSWCLGKLLNLSSDQVLQQLRNSP